MNKALALIAGLALGSMAAYAVPAKPGLRTVTQPDGTTMQVELRGDEYCHFYIGADGKPMQKDADGYLRYVVAAQDGSVALTADAAAASDTQSAFRALNAAATAERIRMQAVDPSVAAATVASNVRAAAESETLPQKGMGLMGRQNFPTIGNIKSVVILVSYKDVDFSVSNPADYYQRHLNQEGFSDYNAVGSCRDFFIENSNGLFVPQFDLYGPVKLQYNRSYYGGDTSTRKDVNAYKMVIEACAALDPTVDFSQYDLDGDGVIDNIYVIYAGQGQASYGSDDTVWPHSSTINNGPTHDGVRVGRYATSNEWEFNRPDGIGTFVHEFSHVMGLPDLYETTYSTGSVTPGEWSTMDQGPYNGNGCCPPYYSSYERNALGWIDLKVVGEPESVQLQHIGASNEAYIIQTPRDNEFFLLETRMRTGWDTYVPGQGLLVWHIDFDQSVFTQNMVNNDPTHQYVDIVECGGEKGATGGYPFPGTAFAKKREISPAKNSLKPWLGPVVPHYITEIYERTQSDGPNYMSFLINGGSAALQTPVATEATELSATGFTANWSAVDDAAGYALTIYAETPGSEAPVNIPFGTESDKTVVLPEGWAFTGASNDVYTTAAFCGEAKPSLKFNENGISLTSPLFSAEVETMSFFLRAGAAKASSMIVVEGRNDESELWKSVAQLVDLTVVNNRGDVFEFDLADSHVRQIRITFYATSGRCGLDDLKLTFGNSCRSIFGDYKAKKVDANSHAVAVEAGGPVKFTYSVAALDSKGVATTSSNTINVDLSNYSGVTNITTDADWTLTTEGLTAVYTGTPGTVMTVYTTTGATVAAAVADASGRAAVELPSAGLYILHTPQGSVKAIAK